MQININNCPVLIYTPELQDLIPGNFNVLNIPMGANNYTSGNFLIFEKYLNKITKGTNNVTLTFNDGVNPPINIPNLTIHSINIVFNTKQSSTLKSSILNVRLVDNRYFCKNNIYTGNGFNITIPGSRNNVYGGTTSNYQTILNALFASTNLGVVNNIRLYPSSVKYDILSQQSSVTTLIDSLLQEIGAILFYDINTKTLKVKNFQDNYFYTSYDTPHIKWGGRCLSDLDSFTEVNVNPYFGMVPSSVNVVFPRSGDINSPELNQNYIKNINTSANASLPPNVIVNPDYNVTIYDNTYVIGPVGSETNLTLINARALDLVNGYILQFFSGFGILEYSGFYIPYNTVTILGEIDIGLHGDRPFIRYTRLPTVPVDTNNIISLNNCTISKNYNNIARISCDSPTLFPAMITGSSSISTNIWSYSFAQVQVNSSSAGTWKTVTGGITGSALNGAEAGDGTTGTISAGWRTGDFCSTGISLAPIRTGAVVMMSSSLDCSTPPNTVYYFSLSNVLQGTC